MFTALWEAIVDIWTNSGFYQLFNFSALDFDVIKTAFTSFENFEQAMSSVANSGLGNLIMLCIACVLIYLAIAKEFEPLLLLPIAFGMLLANLPLGGLMNPQVNEWMSISADQYETSVYPVIQIGEEYFQQHYEAGGLLWYLYQGVKFGIYPPLIFLGIGCMTDFGPLISNPKSFLLGAAAQFGIFVTFFGARALGLTGIEAFTFSEQEAASIAIIGGADGPTAIFLTSKLAPHLLSAIAVAAYSYMALVPVIQPPIMKLLTTKKERSVKMEQLRPVSRLEKLLFPIFVTLLCVLLLPDAAPLVGMLMMGNLMRESGVVDRISKTAQNELMNIITIFLGTTVGATASAAAFLNFKTLFILALGLIAFAFGTAAGVVLGKVMYLVTGGKVNPLIGSAGVSAVPMAARISQKVGQEENPGNFLLMHAMGPNVAGVIGSAVAAGVLLTLFG